MLFHLWSFHSSSCRTHPMFLLFIDIQVRSTFFVMVSAGPNVEFCTEMLPSAISLIVFKAVHSVNTSSPRPGCLRQVDAGQCSTVIEGFVSDSCCLRKLYFFQ